MSSQEDQAPAPRAGRRARGAAIRDEMRAAIERREIETHYQPIVDLRDGRVVRIEALARWTHPSLGPLAPTEFIPIAERSGLIRELWWLVLERALADVTPWRIDLPSLRVAVNVSARSLAGPRVAEEIVRFLEAVGASADSLSLEITESILMADPARSRLHVERLRRIGARVEIDDFGTGYSSLRYLQMLPVDSVKIDRQFVAALLSERRSETIVRAVVGLSHELGFEAVAEGVETHEVWDVLRALGCDSGQGHFVARAMPAQEVPAWIAGWDARVPEIAPTAGEDAEAAARRSILVVDDEPAIRVLVSELLTLEGYHVDTAANGEEALRAVQRHRPALVLVDVHMPVLDGEGFVRALRSRGIRLPVVIMTAGPSAEHWARTLGADAAVAKPFGLADLLAVTERFSRVSAARSS